MLTLCILVCILISAGLPIIYHREFIWSACLSSPTFAICLFNSSNEKHPTGLCVFGISSSCSLGFSASKSL